MEEKVIIKSERASFKNLFIALLAIGIILSVMVYISDYNHWANYYDRMSKKNGDDPYSFTHDYDGRGDYATSKAGDTCVFPVTISVVVSGIVWLWLRSYEMTVTDKRVYGKIAFGKRIDLPVDSVSAIATTRLLNGVSVSTSSGRIQFLCMANADEIYTVINKLLVERQQKKSETAATTTVIQNSDEADKLKKYKELLDSGVITKEEFEEKKKQLLGL